MGAECAAQLLEAREHDPVGGARLRAHRNLDADNRSIASDARDLAYDTVDVVRVLERVGRVHDVERVVGERHVVHVHDEDVVALREDVDSDHVAEPTLAEPVELERVAAADAEDAAAVRPLLCDAVDQGHRADTRIRLPLRQRPPQLHGEVTAVLGRLALAQVAQAEPVRNFREPSETGAQACPDCGAAHAHGAATLARGRVETRVTESAALNLERARSPRRVTVVAHELRGFRTVGGMGTATTFLALALARMGHSVEILLGLDTAEAMDPYWQSVYDAAGVRFRRAPPSREPVEPWPFIHPHSIALGLMADPPDVVIAHDFGAPAYCALRLREAGAFADTLFVVFCHGPRRYVMDISADVAVNDLEPLLAVTVLERLSVELADVVVSPSAYLLGWMREHAWRVPERALVIPYFTRSGATGEAVPKIGATDDGPVRRLAFFGRLDEKKGLRPFAAGLNALDATLLDGLELDFVGKPTATWPTDRVEALLTEPTKRALGQVTFETGLDQHDALERLSRPGTLAVMPTLQDNSPNTVYECLELGIPFIASNVGGIPELIASADRARVLFEPTPEGVEDALRHALSDEAALRPVQSSFGRTTSSERWADVIEMRPQPQSQATEPPVDVVVVQRRPEYARGRCAAALEQQRYGNFRVIATNASSVEAARQEGLRAGSAPYVAFLDEDDVPDDELLATLVRAQAASGAEAVTCGLRLTSARGETTLHFFAGEPGALGVLSNAYGTVGLYRRAALGDVTTPWHAENDPDWALLARLAASGARIVSVPMALVARAIRPGSVDSDRSDALLAVAELERALPHPVRSAARLAAGLAANARAVPASRPPSALGRALAILRSEGTISLARRATRRLVRGAR